MTSKRVRVSSIPDVIYEELRAEIARGERRPGPLNIKALAESYGVSHVPVREALRRLQVEGFVDFGGGRQVVIRKLDLGDLEEIYEIRASLESLAVRKAVPMLEADGDVVQQLRALLSQMRSQRLDYDSWRDTHQTFHMLFYELCGSPRLIRMIDSLFSAVEPYARQYGTTARGLQQAHSQHLKLVELALTNEVDEAVALIQEHLEAGLAVLRKGEAKAKPEGRLA